MVGSLDAVHGAPKQSPSIPSRKKIFNSTHKLEFILTRETVGPYIYIYIYII